MKENAHGNQLFPVFIRLDKMPILVVGGGAVGLEKVEAIFRNSVDAHVTVVAPEIRQEIVLLKNQYANLELLYKPYDSSHLKNKRLVIAATCIKELNQQVYDDAHAQRITCNVADTPELCDFYMCSFVKKGDLKIAISTNGKSPTFAKRMREVLEEVLPDSIQSVLDNLTAIREKLKGDFDFKLKKLDEITSVMKTEKDKN